MPKNDNHPFLGHDQNLKKMATIQTKTNLWVMTKILVRCTLATIQTPPNTRLIEDARGAGARPRSGVAWPTASSGPETMPGRLAFSMTCGVACERRASPMLPRPQLTTLAHQKPLVPRVVAWCVPSRRQLPAFMSSVRMPSLRGSVPEEPTPVI